MKAILPVACAFLAALAAAPISAHAADSLYDAKEWGRTFRRAGIAFNYSETCADRTLSGMYSRKKRQIFLCLNNIRTESQLKETLAHEAMHAAQHCLGMRERMDQLVSVHTALAGKNPETANEWLSLIHERTQSKASGIAYSAQQHNYSVVLEKEAYYMEDYPEEALEWVKLACLGEGK
jgi:hypothetical protein